MMQKVELSLALFSFIIPFCLLSNTAISVDPLFRFCSNNTSNYRFNSTFENNLKYVLESLISNTSLTGFNSTFIGESPDRVYGQALCRGDINSTVCHSCIKNASEDILKACKSKEAIIWYELCQVHYSFQMFFLTMVYTGKFPDWDSQQSYLSNPAHFNEVLMYLMNNLSSEAANVPEKNMFATGEIKFSRSKTIYGLVQCTRDISVSDCSVCLKNAFGDLNACCYSQEGGIVLSRNCNARFQLDRFYNSSSFLVIYPASKGNKWKTWIIVASACISTLILAVLIGSFAVCIRNRRSDKDKEKCEQAFLNDLSSPTHVAVTQESDLTNTEELPFFDLVSIIAATENFSDSNKLGQGGFGAVYKGVLSDGKEIAVKRLSRTSWHGFEEFKNEVKLIAKLQHRNLVRLLGYGVEGDEKLLIYEFMPNRSLDIFIFDFERRPQLNWKTSYNILCGIARGLLYLHEDSRLKIIHRDLKPSNVLLDHEMTAKISDFGMARIFGQNQNTANTRRIVGTYGYMAPEYAMEGLFSVKSDVFSFGVILLEIISGKRNNVFFHTEHSQTLLAFAWRLWKERKALELADPFLIVSSQPEEVLRCIHIGLLCVQEDPADRPNMSYVVALLGNSSISLPEPGQPAFSFGRVLPMTPSIVSPR